MQTLRLPCRAYPPAVRKRRAGLSVGAQKLALEHRCHTHAARRADRDQAAPRSPLRELLGERCDDARPGCSERVPERDAAALRVELCAVYRAERCATTQPLAAIFFRFPCLQRAQHLRSESLVDFVDVE